MPFYFCYPLSLPLTGSLSQARLDLIRGKQSCEYYVLRRTGSAAQSHDVLQALASAKVMRSLLFLVLVQDIQKYLIVKFCFFVNMQRTDRVHSMNTEFHSKKTILLFLLL